MMAKGIEGCCKGVRVETTSLLQRRLCETLGMRSKYQKQSMLPIWYLIRLCPYTAKVGVSLLIEILILTRKAYLPMCSVNCTTTYSAVSWPMAFCGWAVTPAT